MNRNQKILLWAVGGASVIALGVGGYFWYKNHKNKVATENDAEKKKREEAAKHEAEQVKKEVATTGNANATLPSGFPIRKGDTGNNVVRAQQALMDLGYDTGGADGDYGSKTTSSASKAKSGGDGSIIYEADVVAWETKAKQKAINSKPTQWQKNDKVTVIKNMNNITRYQKSTKIKGDWNPTSTKGSLETGDNLYIVDKLTNRMFVVRTEWNNYYVVPESNLIIE
jgi:peptidoglycan hydrolase-like protein with peptidoglycan-binding domain